MQAGEKTGSMHPDFKTITIWISILPLSTLQQPQL